jgi:hypothetical protein
MHPLKAMRTLILLLPTVGGEWVAPEFRYTLQNPTNLSVEGPYKADLPLSIRF